MTLARHDSQAVKLAPNDLISLDDINQNSLKKDSLIEKAERKQKIAVEVTNLYEKFSVFYALTAEILKLLDIGLKSVPILSEAVDGIELALAAVIAGMGAMQKDGKWRRRIKIVAGVSLIGVAIASLALPEAALTIFIISASIGFFKHVWNFGAAVISRLRGSWKKTIDQLAKDEAEFYELLAKEPNGLKVLKSARGYAEANRQLREQDEQVKTAAKEIPAPKETIKPSPIHYDKADVAFEKQLAKHKKDNAGKPAAFLQAKQPNPFVTTHVSEADFFASLKDEEKRIIELDKKIHQTREVLSDRGIDEGSDFVDFVVASVAIAGAALMFTPFAPIGVGMIIGSVVFGVCRAFDFPGKWVTRFTDYFFEPGKVESYESIENKVLLKAADVNKPQVVNTPSNNANLFKKLNNVPAPVLAPSPPAPSTAKPQSSGFFNLFKKKKVVPAPVPSVNHVPSPGLGLH